MKTSFHLVINSKGSVRTVKTPPHLAPNEISLKLSLELPDSLFRRPTLEASIKVNEDQVTPRVLTPDVIEDISKTIQQSLGADLRIIIHQTESE